MIKVAGILEVPNATLKGNQAYDLLRREIVSCRILPGTRFTEAELMERLELGKATCRIALQRLISGRVCLVDPAAWLSGDAGHRERRRRRVRVAGRTGADRGAQRHRAGQPRAT